MRRRLAVLLVDALGYELAGRFPGFAGVLPHRRPLETVLGFSSGALPTLFTGKPPCEHGRWLMYRRAQPGVRSPFAGFRRLGALPPRLRRSWKLSRLLTRLVERRGVRGYFDLYEVPRELLEEFDLAERDDIFAPGGLPGGSFWDAVERSGVRWRGWNWRTPEPEALAAAGRALAEGPEDLVFCYTAELDAALHREGSGGAGVRERLARYDVWLRRVAEAAAGRGEELRLVLLSDHGMVDVRESVDVMGALGGLSCRWPRDYLPFFDSTFARFWWRADGARREVRGALERLGGGRWLEDDELERAGVRFPAREYGDDVFLLDPGVLMVPSFMGSRPLAAMHGYDPAHPGMAALLACDHEVPAGLRRLADVRAFLEDELAWLRGER
jgi:hypothetical protein